MAKSISHTPFKNGGGVSLASTFSAENPKRNREGDLDDDESELDHEAGK